MMTKENQAEEESERKRKKKVSAEEASSISSIFCRKKSSIVIVNRETIAVSPRHSVTDTEEIAFQVGGNVLVTG